MYIACYYNNELCDKMELLYGITHQQFLNLLAISYKQLKADYEIKNAPYEI